MVCKTYGAGRPSYLARALTEAIHVWINNRQLGNTAEFMRRIKYRTDVIRRTEAAYRLGTSITGYRQTDIDLCYLQLRKSLELMMFASVIAHDSLGVIWGNA